MRTLGILALVLLVGCAGTQSNEPETPGNAQQTEHASPSASAPVADEPATSAQEPASTEPETTESATSDPEPTTPVAEEPTSHYELPEVKDTYWADLQPGQCFNMETVATAEGGIFEMVDCSTPHDTQVVKRLPVEGDFPGEDMPALGKTMCEQVVYELVQRHPELTVKSVHFTPAESAWDQGVRHVTCTIESTDGPLTRAYL